MEVNKEDLSFYNNHLELLEDIQLLQPLDFNAKSDYYEGVVSIRRNKIAFDFKIQIPTDYPFQDLKFTPSNLVGYPHQNHDQTVCLNTPFIDHIYTRFQLDLKKIKGWLDHYVLQEKQDVHYEYSPADYSGRLHFVFQEESYNPTRFEQAQFGEMHFSAVNLEYDDKKIQNLTLICQEIGNRIQPWSYAYQMKEKFLGLWVLLDREPIHGRKDRVTQWKDLNAMLPEEFYSFFATFCKKIPGYKLGPKSFRKHITVAIGYAIPGPANLQEVQWDLILLPKASFPKKHNNITGLLRKYDKKIIWEKTLNASYKRFFGRGAFSEKLTNSKVLVIGLGAVGSSLCETLVRGGIKNLAISDIDLVEPGNICRSSYYFAQTGKTKGSSLTSNLLTISPFVDVEIIADLVPTSPYSKRFQELEKILSQYDYVFDCSANNSMIQMLSSMQSYGTIYYISITNKAREMLCVSSIDSGSMIDRRNQMLFSLNQIHEPEFREGTGCWHPTFEAGYFDINLLLQYSLKKIDSNLSLNLPVKSFYSYLNNGRLDSSEDISFIQPDLGLKLKIESHCLDTIYKLVWEHYPKEFGGILIGNYLNNYQEAIISKVLYPTDFKNTTTNFQPNPKDLNQQLRKLEKTYQDRLVYLGDWHSHPDSNNQFSRPDFDSISRVAGSSQVNTHNPLLLIVAFSKNEFDPGFYVFYQGMLHKYERVN